MIFFPLWMGKALSDEMHASFLHKATPIAVYSVGIPSEILYMTDATYYRKIQE
jgi:hypothetical protein